MRSRTLGCGAVLLLLGLWIWLSALGVPYIDFGRNWPLILVALGLYIIIRRIVQQLRGRRSVDRVISDLEAGRIDVDEAVSRIRRSK